MQPNYIQQQNVQNWQEAKEMWSQFIDAERLHMLCSLLLIELINLHIHYID